MDFPFFWIAILGGVILPLVIVATLLALAL
jgi:hypothetical protein